MNSQWDVECCWTFIRSLKNCLRNFWLRSLVSEMCNGFIIFEKIPLTNALRVHLVWSFGEICVDCLLDTYLGFERDPEQDSNRFMFRIRTNSCYWIEHSIAQVSSRILVRIRIRPDVKLNPAQNFSRIIFTIRNAFQNSNGNLEKKNVLNVWTIDKIFNKILFRIWTELCS